MGVRGIQRKEVIERDEGESTKTHYLKASKSYSMPSMVTLKS